MKQFFIMILFVILCVFGYGLYQRYDYWYNPVHYGDLDVNYFKEK